MISVSKKIIAFSDTEQKDANFLPVIISVGWQKNCKLFRFCKLFYWGVIYKSKGWASKVRQFKMSNNGNKTFLKLFQCTLFLLIKSIC